MALKVDEIMDLSLDDYIEMSKVSNNTNAVTNNNNDKVSRCSKDAKFGRRRGNIEDEEEEEDEDDLKIQDFNEIEKIDIIENSDTGVWKAPDSSTAYLDCHDKHNDLREKLNSNHNSNRNARASGIQYRLMAPNNAANRPRGIPTLLPLDAYVQKQPNNYYNGFRRNWRRGRGANHGYRGINNQGCNFQNGNNCFVGGGINNGRVQRNRPKEIESKNLRFSFNQNKDNNFNISESTASPTRARNMIIETPISNINLQPSAPLSSSFQIPQSSSVRSNYVPQSIPIGNLTPQVEAALNLSSNANKVPSCDGSNNESLKSLLGFQGNVTSDMMPVFASRLMDFIQNGLQTPVHKPIYDMKIQKDIHEIQKKPLLYKCPGGEVVSSDGGGVNCKIIPRTSGVSLNCRFA